MRLYVHMVLCGSICTLLYLFFNNVLPYELPLNYKRRLLRINTAFYLLPVPWIAAEVKQLFRWILEKAGAVFPQDSSPDIFDATSMWKSFVVLNEKGRIIHITGYRKAMPVILSVVAVCLALVSGWIFCYIRTSMRCKRTMLFLDTEHYVKDKNTRRKIAVGISPYCVSPVAVGLFKPAILLPVDHREYEQSMEEVILHELNHVQCMDIVERFLCFVVVVVHFFNPLAHFLFREDIAVSEMLSDEAAVNGKTKKQKADYIKCIMAASRKSGSAKVTAPSLGISKSLLRKRMERIMESGKKKIWKKKTAVVVVTGCALASSITALAYQKPREYIQTGRDSWNNQDILAFTPTGGENPMAESRMDFDFGDTVFVGEDGTVHYEFRWEQEQKQNICAHSYTSGTVSEHDRHADGGCSVVSYQADKCTKCGAVVTGGEISTATYKVCPHLAEGATQAVQNPSNETGQPESKLGIVNTKTLKMRAQADGSAEVTMLLMAGEEVTITAEENDFYQIWLLDSDGEWLSGYVRKEYVDMPELFREMENEKR